MHLFKVLTLGTALVLDTVSSSCDPVQELVGQCPTVLGTVVRRNNVRFNGETEMQITISAKEDGRINYVISPSQENPEWAEYHELQTNHDSVRLENLAKTMPVTDKDGLLRKYLLYASNLAQMAKS